MEQTPATAKADSGEPFRPGDVLRISCPFTGTRVTRRNRYHVSLRWPWWTIDPDSESTTWNGDCAIPRAPGDREWNLSFFRTEPSAELLNEGDPCKVGIPPTIAHVIEVAHYDPPQVTGYLPRPHREVVLLKQGESEDRTLDHAQGQSFDPDDEQPVAMELLFRPYAFLDIGDEVADRDGRAWRFDAPWDWYPFDDGAAGSPRWPLRLLYRDGEPSDTTSARVEDATRAGSHAEELARWQRWTKADPPRTASPDHAR